MDFGDQGSMRPRFNPSKGFTIPPAHIRELIRGNYVSLAFTAHVEEDVINFVPYNIILESMQTLAILRLQNYIRSYSKSIPESYFD